MAVDAYDVDPTDIMVDRLQAMGRLLAALCCLWIAVVGSVLIQGLTPEDMENHRAQVVQDRMKGCEGEFSQRYACTDQILINGNRHGFAELAMRLGTTLILPGTAWFMWRRVLDKAQRLRTPRHLKNRNDADDVAWAS